VPVTICIRRMDATLENETWTWPVPALSAYLQVVLSECRRLGCPADERIQALWASECPGTSYTGRHAPAKWRAV
jgi:hypothetical protein